MWQRTGRAWTTLVVVCGLSLACGVAHAALDLASERIVQAGGTDLVVGGYSVPSFVDWNQDGLPDLVIGEGGGVVTIGKVRVYLNSGSLGLPEFNSFFYAQAGGVDLAWPASGCMGVFPRVVQWDGDGQKDLIVGLADGRLRFYMNVATNAAPAFDAGVFLMRSGSEIDVGYRATLLITDWNVDGRKDLVVGALDGRVLVYLNEGTDTAPLFLTETAVQAAGADLFVPSGRSSPCRADLDGDGRQDILCGNTDGQLLLYKNSGSDISPVFLGFEAVTAMGVPIDLEGTPRSRPSLCDWNDDGGIDVLVGSDDGKARLYLGNSPVMLPESVSVPSLAITPYPNPFYPITTLAFDLPRTSAVRLSAFSASGERVLHREACTYAPGRHGLTWDGRDDAGRLLPSGTYLLLVDTPEGVARSKVTLVR